MVISLCFADDSLFKKGNEAYQNRNYTLALEYYQQIENNGMESTALYYNMGNSYYKLNKLGYAILYYEKAKKLSPLDDDIVENLKVVNKRVIDHIAEPDQIYLFKLYQSIKYMFNINDYLWTSFYLFTSLLILIFIRRFVFIDIVQKVTNVSVYVFIVLLSVSVFMSFLRLSDYNINHGVLLVEAAEIYTAPDTNSQAFILHEGAKFKINRELNDRYEVSLIDGKTGWIDKSQVGTI